MNAVPTAAGSDASDGQHVTVTIAGQLFGFPILAVEEVFQPAGITKVPLAPPEVEGVLSLRGRIVTMISLRDVLGFAREGTSNCRMAIRVDFEGDAYGLLVDEVGDVMRLDGGRREPIPSNLDRHWAEFLSGVHRLQDSLLLMVDVERALRRLRASYES